MPLSKVMGELPRNRLFIYETKNPQQKKKKHFPRTVTETSRKLKTKENETNGSREGGRFSELTAIMLISRMCLC